ncbi:MAG: hypothetical protein NWF01_12590 [Candidatus Bathyarchaeota archaeon]|nr:hypothetical protein [Candidatus Bathyarchaeota archaeon]
MADNDEILGTIVSGSGNGLFKPRTTIGLKAETKQMLDKNRAPGQCYDGFICQLVDLWEKSSGNGKA